MPEITEEELKQMSPEQLKEVQKQQCIFCHIISGKVASKKIYEDDRCLAILDINPANPGHVLILPKEHHAIMPLMPESDVCHLFKVAKKVSMAQIRGLKAGGANIFAANGAAAGQKAPHFMLHVVPRKDNDGVKAFNLPKNQIAKDDLEKLRQAIKAKVNEQFGIADKEPVVFGKEPEQVETTVAGPEPAAEPEPASEPEQEETPAETEEEPSEVVEETSEQETEHTEEASPEETFDLPAETEEQEAEPEENESGSQDTTEEYIPQDIEWRQEDKQEQEENPELTEEEKEMFTVPPPEPNHEEFEKHKEEETKKKKKVDLDAIGGLFK